MCEPKLFTRLECYLLVKTFLLSSNLISGSQSSYRISGRTPEEPQFVRREAVESCSGKTCAKDLRTPCSLQISNRGLSWDGLLVAFLTRMILEWRGASFPCSSLTISTRVNLSSPLYLFSAVTATGPFHHSQCLYT